MGTSRWAHGASGHLINTDGTYFFRVYNYDDGSFVDYAIFHSDLYITIEDPDAFFYKKESGLYHDVLDHSPSTLGIDSNGEN